MESRSGSCSVDTESVRLLCWLGGGRYREKECSALCSNVCDACTTSCVIKIKVYLECDVSACDGLVYCSYSTATKLRFTWE